MLGSTLKDKNQDVRFGSALSLAQLYENGNKTFISSGNTDAFKKIISKEVVPTLITALQDKDKDVRIATVEALGEIGKDAIPALISALQDKDKDVRTAAVEALWLIGNDVKIENRPAELLVESR